MRFFTLSIVFILLIGSSKLFSQDLDTFQPSQCILLIKDTNLESDWLKAQLKRLQSNSKELVESDVIILILTDKAVYDENRKQLALKSELIIEKYKLNKFAGLVLIGKDRKAKHQEEFIVSPAKILAIIDRMPAPIAELKN